MYLEKKATTGLVCGIISVSLMILCYFVLGFGEIAALVLGIIATVNGAKTLKLGGKSVAALVLGIIGILGSFIGVLVWFIALIMAGLIAATI